MGRWNAVRLVTGYYLATPAFAIADLGFGLPVRVAAIIPTGPRVGYYAAVFALGLLCRARPGATPWVGMIESVSNLLILLLSILLPIWNLTGAVASGGPLEDPGLLTVAGAANALLSGTALIVSFHRHQTAALGSGRRPRLPGDI